MTRRTLLTGAAAAAAMPPLLAKSANPRLAMEGYIWNQYLGRKKKSVAEGLDEVIPMARAAGFDNIELNNSFFGPEVRPRLGDLLHAEKLFMPTVYVGGAMHTREGAEQTTRRALDIGGFCKAFGCRAVINNPDPKGPPKTDSELELQAVLLNRMKRELQAAGLELIVHHHSPEMADNAREWRHILKHTDVSLCIDVDWVHQGGQDPLAILQEAGDRVAELHLRSSHDKLWDETLEDGDVDYRPIAAFLRRHRFKPLLVVELAYAPKTAITRPLVDDLRLGRLYAERIFGH